MFQFYKYLNDAKAFYESNKRSEGDSLLELLLNEIQSAKKSSTFSAESVFSLIKFIEDAISLNTSYGGYNNTLFNLQDNLFNLYQDGANVALDKNMPAVAIEIYSKMNALINKLNFTDTNEEEHFKAEINYNLGVAYQMLAQKVRDNVVLEKSDKHFSSACTGYRASRLNGYKRSIKDVEKATNENLKIKSIIMKSKNDRRSTRLVIRSSARVGGREEVTQHSLGLKKLLKTSKLFCNKYEVEKNKFDSQTTAKGQRESLRRMNGIVNQISELRVQMECYPSVKERNSKKLKM